MINVAMLSKWHVHAKDYASQALQNDNITIKVVWDEILERGKEWAQELNVLFEPDLKKVLEDPEIDAVIIDTPTNLHKEVIIQAAKHKKHIFSEKVLAFTVQDCEEIFSSIKENNVKLMVSLPRLTEDYYLYAQEILDQGFLGNLTSIRCRCAHNGAVPFDGHSYGWLPEHFFKKEECGGGALIDLGAHPIYITNRLAGPAKAVTARLNHTLGYEVDDNAVALVEYESGVLATIETSFLSNGCPFQLELYGTEGTLLIEDNIIRLKSKQLDGENWNIPDQLPQSLPMPLDQWANAIIGGKDVSIRQEDIMNLTLINQAAILSNEKGQRIEISDLMAIK